MNKEVKEFIEAEGLSKHLSTKRLVRTILKYNLYFLILCIYYLATVIGKAKSNLFSITSSYGIMKSCSKCVYGKSREVLFIISATGYSRNDKVLQVMNTSYSKKNYCNNGNCLGYSKCGKCLDVISGKDTSKPCVFI